MSGIVFTRYRSEAREHQRLGEFHGRSVLLLNEASQGLGNLERLGRSDDLDGPIAERRAELALRTIGDAVETLGAIQDGRDYEPMQGSVARAIRQYGELSESFAEGGVASLLSSPQLDAFDLTLFQLSRLHSLAAEDLLRTTDRRRNTTRGIFGLATLLVFIVAGLVVRRTLQLLEAAMGRHAVTAADLQERDRQLQQATKMEALGTLVGGIAHDFNNLLTVILGHAAMVHSALDREDPAAEDVQEITKAGERAATLTRQLLAFARREPVEARVVDLNLVLRDLQPLLRRLLPADIQLDIRPDRSPCRVEIDPIQIEQVIVNLAVNGRDAMRDGGTLIIRTASRRFAGADPSLPAIAPGRYAQITVEDTGVGMDPELRARIFEPFFTTKERGRGTGLGLSTVHGIVQRGHGHISVESATGTGTRFEIFLPAAEDAAETEAAAEEAPLPTLRRATILLVEDEDQIRRLAVTGLRAAGYRVIEAGDGEEALALCTESDARIDLILTDVVMPRMRGPALVEKALAHHPDARVVFMSGYDDSELAPSTQQGAFLHKPFKLEQLLEAVALELAKAEAPSETASA